MQMIRANTNIVRGELIDRCCINKVPVLAITMNIDRIVLQDLIGNDIVPKKSKLLGNLDASSNP